MVGLLMESDCYYTVGVTEIYFHLNLYIYNDADDSSDDDGVIMSQNYMYIDQIFDDGENDRTIWFLSS